ncbi:MAG: alpha/beta hydrolase [Pseudomonadota bacterium]
MPNARVGELDLCYETFGDQADPAIILIMGVGCQMILWPESLCEGLADKGYFVVRFDNRDVGLSTSFEQAGRPNIMDVAVAAFSGQPVEVPYTLDDMADDTAGLMNVLGLERAHIVGASMGGMIAQLVAIRHPGLTKSLVSIMSTTGRRDLPTAKPEVMQLLMTPPKDLERDTLVEFQMAFWRAIGSPDYPATDTELRSLCERIIDRQPVRSGFLRQMAAILTAPPRNESLSTVSAPTLVLHGADDPFVRVECGEDTAASIPGAELSVVPGMGHDYTEALLPVYLREIGGFLDRVEGR